MNDSISTDFEKFTEIRTSQKYYAIDYESKTDSSFENDAVMIVESRHTFTDGYIYNINIEILNENLYCGKFYKYMISARKDFVDNCETGIETFVFPENDSDNAFFYYDALDDYFKKSFKFNSINNEYSTSMTISDIQYARYNDEEGKDRSNNSIFFWDRGDSVNIRKVYILSYSEEVIEKNTKISWQGKFIVS